MEIAMKEIARKIVRFVGTVFLWLVVVIFLPLGWPFAASLALGEWLDGDEGFLAVVIGIFANLIWAGFILNWLITWTP